MTNSAANASAFYREVSASQKLWTVRDKAGFPAPLVDGNKRSQPFWSSLARAKKIIATVPAYADFEPVEIKWQDFTDKWVPGLTKDQTFVGVNWSGPSATGYDIHPIEVKTIVEAAT